MNLVVRGSSGPCSWMIFPGRMLARTSPPQGQGPHDRWRRFTGCGATPPREAPRYDSTHRAVVTASIENPPAGPSGADSRRNALLDCSDGEPAPRDPLCRVRRRAPRFPLRSPSRRSAASPCAFACGLRLGPSATRVLAAPPLAVRRLADRLPWSPPGLSNAPTLAPSPFLQWRGVDLTFYADARPLPLPDAGAAALPSGLPRARRDRALLGIVQVAICPGPGANARRLGPARTGKCHPCRAAVTSSK